MTESQHTIVSLLEKYGYLHRDQLFTFLHVETAADHRNVNRNLKGLKDTGHIQAIRFNPTTREVPPSPFMYCLKGTRDVSPMNAQHHLMVTERMLKMPSAVFFDRRANRFKFPWRDGKVKVLVPDLDFTLAGKMFHYELEKAGIGAKGYKSFEGEVIPDILTKLEKYAWYITSGAFKDRWGERGYTLSGVRVLVEMPTERTLDFLLAQIEKRPTVQMRNFLFTYTERAKENPLAKIWWTWDGGDPKEPIQ